MDENDIMQLITSEYSWEQIIYKIIAWEGMDPWNLDLSLLSRSFLQHISKMAELDFKIPAKYVVIAAVLLRMKSDHIEYMKSLTRPEDDFPGIEQPPEEAPLQTPNGEIGLALASLEVPSKRQPTRKIVVKELISALRNALRTEERRKEKGLRRRGQIVINEENITERIESLYRKIDTLLARLREEEIEFSKLVKSWTREEVLNTFIPLVHLDHDKKVRCRQEELFTEIYVKKAIPGQAEGEAKEHQKKAESGPKPDRSPKPASKKLKSAPGQKVKGQRG